MDIIVQKAKPKEVGQKGIFQADYNWHTGRYFERVKSEDTEKPIMTKGEFIQIAAKLTDNSDIKPIETPF